MNWGSLSAFIEMGGYGGYVWGSFGVTAVCFVLEAAAVAARRRSLLRERRELD
jgi:heme exporter protein D